MRLFTVLALLASSTARAEDHLQHYSLSHSGKLVAIQQADGSAVVADVTSGDQRVLSKEAGGAYEFSWTPDDKSLYVSRNGTISDFAVHGRLMKRYPGSANGSLIDVSPNGRYVAYVHENNLFIDSDNGRTQKQLTSGGSGNLLIGVPDLVYGKEFDVSRHYWWSPDSSAIAYIETEFADADHYVIAGGKLPVFRLKIVEIGTGKIQTVSESGDDWSYLLRVAWHPDSKRLFFYRMNRLQQSAELCVFDGEIKTFLPEKDAYWINAPETPVFVNAGKGIVVSSERSGAKHVYVYGLDGHLICDATPKDTEVYRLYATEDGMHIYVSGVTGNRQDQQLFRMNLDGASSQPLTPEPGWHEVRLNAAGDAFLDYHSSVSKPPQVDWHGTDGKMRELVAASSDEKPVANEYFTIKTHDDVQLPARLFKPDDFDPLKKYPVILYTFSGPNGRVVTDEWGDWQMAWNRSMVRKGFLILAVDVRGSAGYGHLFEEYIHYRLGAQETADLREVVSYLRRQSYVDSSRLGIWGCGYGAGTVVHAMWQFPGGFKAGFADSPIADWTKYDAYFTERYLGLPAKRFTEYDDSGPLHDARRMTGSLMVVSNPDDAMIRPVHVDALKNSMSHLKRNPEVAKRFFAVKRPGDLTELSAQMTEFFKANL